jgi:hypothetical protein
LIYVLFFVGVTAVWGWTFAVVKNAIAEYPTLPFLRLRFLLAPLKFKTPEHEPSKT